MGRVENDCRIEVSIYKAQKKGYYVGKIDKKVIGFKIARRRVNVNHG